MLHGLASLATAAETGSEGFLGYVAETRMGPYVHSKGCVAMMPTAHRIVTCA